MALTYWGLGLCDSSRPLFLLCFQFSEECTASCLRSDVCCSSCPERLSCRACRPLCACFEDHEPQLLAF